MGYDYIDVMEWHGIVMSVKKNCIYLRSTHHTDNTQY